MGYFSNSTEGEIFHNQYCACCVHEDGCPVWELHMLWNYEQQDSAQDATPQEAKCIALDTLMPRNDFKNICSMFHQKPAMAFPNGEDRQIIVLWTQKGERNVDAIVCGDFAVHLPIGEERYNQDCFVVTHIPTSLAAQHGLAFDKAIELAERLAGLTVDTSFTDASPTNDVFKAFVEVARPIILEYRQP